MAKSELGLHRESPRERGAHVTRSPAGPGAGHMLLRLQQQAGNRATAELVQRDGPGAPGTATPPVRAPDPGPPPPPPSTERPTTIENQPLPPVLRTLLAQHPLLGPALSGTGGAARPTAQSGAGPPTPRPATPATPGGAGARGSPPARQLPDTDPIVQGQETVQVGGAAYGGNRDFVPFLISGSLGFPSHWAIQDWRYHEARRGDVAWWEHLSFLGAPVLGVGIGPSVGNEVHLQPSLTLGLLQYHMTQGDGPHQLDNDFVLSTILQGDANLATGAFGTQWLTQLAWVRTDASTSLFSIWAQGGVDLSTGAGSVTLGITMGLEQGSRSAPRGN